MANRPRPTSQEVLTKIQELEDFLNNLQMIPASKQYRSAVILPLLSKALTIGRAICALVDAGFPAEAFAMSRTLIETYFNVRYIGNKDTEKRAKRYVDYHTRVRQEWQKIIMQFYPNKPVADTQLDPEILERAKAFKKSKWVEGDAGQVEIMALEEDPLDLDANGQPEKADFDLVLYFWTSHFVHVTVPGIEAHVVEPGSVFKVRARSWIDAALGGNALFNATTMLAKIFVKGLRVMNEAQPPVLDEMFKMISGLAAQTEANGERMDPDE